MTTYEVEFEELMDLYDELKNGDPSMELLHEIKQRELSF